MSTTTLSIIGTPGKPQSFSPKAPASGAGPHTGTFTELSVTATPGPIHSFSAKDEAAAPSGPHTGLFTALSNLALPGQRHSFSAKTEAIIVTPPKSPEVYLAPRGGGGYAEPEKRLESRRDRILKEDDEIMQLVAQIVASGLLE